jgi:hypothetical protein
MRAVSSIAPTPITAQLEHSSGKLSSTVGDFLSGGRAAKHPMEDRTGRASTRQISLAFGEQGRTGSLEPPSGKRRT